MRRRTERGAAAVEFALVMPILLMIVFAIISFGFIFAQDLALGNAARQTARFSVVESSTCAEIRDQAVSAAAPLVDMNATDSVITITRVSQSGSTTPVCNPGGLEPCKSSSDKDNIHVNLHYKADVLIPVFPGMGNTMDLDGEGVFRCEWF